MTNFSDGTGEALVKGRQQLLSSEDGNRKIAKIWYSVNIITLNQL